MGSPTSETGRRGDEGPTRRVRLSQPFALSKTEVTVAQFRLFADATGYVTDSERDGTCRTFVLNDEWEERPSANWRAPGFVQDDMHPVVCISWNDARAFVDWLARQTGKPYRLPSETEWEYAARAGTKGKWTWGKNLGDSCREANIADMTTQVRFPAWTVSPCQDQALYTGPVGRYRENAFGLLDMIGNVWEWTEDCYLPSYDAPKPRGECTERVRRGGSWLIHPDNARPARRAWGTATARSDGQGIRVARSLP